MWAFIVVGGVTVVSWSCVAGDTMRFPGGEKTGVGVRLSSGLDLMLVLIVLVAEFWACSVSSWATLASMSKCGAMPMATMGIQDDSRSMR